MSNNAREFELQFGAGTYQKRDISLVKGEGCYVFDADGKRYLDCVAGIGSALLGHAHPVLVKAVSEQMSAISSVPELFCNPVRAAFQEKFVSSLPPNINRVFLCNSGTESVEGALKFARLATGRHGVVALKGGYHGKTLGALSATAEEKYREPFAPLLEGFRHASNQNIEALEQEFSNDPSVGAFIFEAIQGESGVRPIDSDFLRQACRIARESGAMIIADEVQCGMGRTGKMWGFEEAGIEPDLVCCSKGIAGGVPMGAIGIGDRIPALPQLSHTSTFGGNPLACAAGLAVLNTLSRDDLLTNAQIQGNRISEAVVQADLKRVREVRGRGLMVGIELKEHAGQFLQPLADKGLLVLLAGQRVIRLLPPLILTSDQSDFISRTLIEVLGTP
jgi:acetylornithine/LysW-gamma-L-lysine aminotransferase